METQINPEMIINDLLEQNKQLTLQTSVLRAALAQADARAQQLEARIALLGEQSSKAKATK